MWMMWNLVHLSMILLNIRMIPLEQIHSSGIFWCGIFSILLKIFRKKEYFFKKKLQKKFKKKKSQLPIIWKGIEDILLSYLNFFVDDCHLRNITNLKKQKNHWPIVSSFFWPIPQRWISCNKIKLDRGYFHVTFQSDLKVPINCRPAPRTVCFTQNYMSFKIVFPKFQNT